VSEGKTVKVFSLPTCPHCQRVKTYLEKNGIVYQSVDVSEDRQARAEMIEKSGQMGVPVIDIDGEILLGFNETRLKEALSLK